jgi:hypothetical protein
MPEGPSFPECFDPYLRYAIWTDFKDFEFFDNDKFSLFLLAELKHAKDVTKFEKEMSAFGVEFGPDFVDTRYVTLRGKRQTVQRDTWPIWREHVSRVELSLPVKPSTTAFSPKRMIAPRFEQGKDPPGSLLIGVLDDGCPFAAAHFLKLLGSGAVSTRVRGIWDQNQDKQPVTMPGGREFGQMLTDFGYGLEYRRDFASSSTPKQIGLDEWIGMHSTATRSIDEEGCYADAGFTSLARRQSHGAHVMDAFVGRIPISSRIGPSPPGDPRDPPTWTPDTGPASNVDLVFVQFSRDCIRDATGVWLKNYVIHGINYILSFADPTITENVIVNISYGPTTGPHDGTAVLEAAMTALVAEFDGVNRKPRLEIVLAAGNSYMSEAHVLFVRNANQPDHVEWIWRLPPDNTVLCFAEVWVDSAHAGPASVTLTSPSGHLFTSTSPAGRASVGGPMVWGSHTMWHLAVGPTIAAPATVAEHGDWTITVSHIVQGAEVHAYVARTDPNMGVRTGAKRSYFVDPIWQQTRSAEASNIRIDGEFDKTGSLVSRNGTLNAIATAQGSSVHVAGGYVVATGRKSVYSSAGPARSGTLTRRPGPDFLLPCDESYALGGIRAGGTRSGAVFRLRGTSAAAPQLARHVANPPIPSAKNVPTSPGEIAKRGGGNIEPP